jgi:hypothetical protein
LAYNNFGTPFSGYNYGAPFGYHFANPFPYNGQYYPMAAAPAVVSPVAPITTDTAAPVTSSTA